MRKSRADSTNISWRNTSFRGYADYMQTEPFLHALDELIAIARDRPTAIMCAESLPWRCHRSLIADALVVRGWDVRDIMDVRTARPHELPAFAIVEGTTIEYRGPTEKSERSQPSLFGD